MYQAPPQLPIDSGYDADSTAREVLKGVDLTGKTAIVTGGYSGLGLETVRALKEAGGDIVVAGRRPHVGREALKDVPSISVEELDLAEPESIQRFAERFLDSGRPLHILINNAAVMACPEEHIGPGWEKQFAINHLGHFMLVQHLWPALRQAGSDSGARVISVSSAGHHHSPVRWNDIHFRREPYHKWKAYGQSKTANALFARHLDRLGESCGVRSFSIHPGSILTPLQRHMTREEMMNLGWVDEQGRLIDPSFKTAEQGAATQVWAATSPMLEGMGGVYCEDCDIAEPAASDDRPFTGIRDYAADPKQAERLWDLSVDETGLNTIT